MTRPIKLTIPVDVAVALDILRGAPVELEFHASEPGVEIRVPARIEVLTDTEAPTPPPRPPATRRPPAGTTFRCPDCGEEFPTPQAQGAHRRYKHPRTTAPPTSLESVPDQRDEDHRMDAAS